MQMRWLNQEKIPTPKTLSIPPFFRGRTSAGGRVSNATALSATAASLKASMVEHMWNGTQFCDGVCSEVQGRSLLMTNMFALALGMLQPDQQGTWATGNT